MGATYATSLIVFDINVIRSRKSLQIMEEISVATAKKKVWTCIINI